MVEASTARRKRGRPDAPQRNPEPLEPQKRAAGWRKKFPGILKGFEGGLQEVVRDTLVLLTEQVISISFPNDTIDCNPRPCQGIAVFEKLQCMDLMYCVI